MRKIKYTSIKPEFVFEHEGVRIKAEQMNSDGCGDCFFYECGRLDNCKKYPCYPKDINAPKQKHNLIFQKVENE